MKQKYWEPTRSMPTGRILTNYIDALPQKLALGPDGTIKLISARGRMLDSIRSRLWFDELATYMGTPFFSKLHEVAQAQMPEFVRTPKPTELGGLGDAILLDPIGSDRHASQVLRLFNTMENPNEAKSLLPYMLGARDGGRIDVLSYSEDEPLGVIQSAFSSLEEIASYPGLELFGGGIVLLYDSYRDWWCPRYGFFMSHTWREYLGRLAHLNRLMICQGGTTLYESK